MKINLHAGHNPDGKVACGAIGLIKESTEARKVVSEMIKLLQKEGVTVFDCTVNNGTSQNDVLKKIIANTNKNNVDLDVSIHFNAGVNDLSGNKLTTGVECLVFSTNSTANTYAKRICEKVSSLGFKNRGVKTRTNLYYLRATQSPSVLVECCFIDDKDDVDLYDAQKMAKAIVEGILNKNISENSTSSDSNSNQSKKSFGVEIYDFLTNEHAINFSKTLLEKENAFNVVEPRLDKWCVKVFDFETKEKAENFKNLVQTKYNAFSVVFEK